MNTKTISFTRHISHREEGSYLLLPFSVPPNVWRLEIRYEYPRCLPRLSASSSRCAKKNVVDFALCSASGQYLGASGSARDTIRISSPGSSDGYAAVPAESGEWHIIAGAYRIRPEGVDVFYRITFWIKEEILLKGDPHTHSLRSDGAFSPRQLSIEAQKRGLDFLFLTDHNNSPFPCIPFPETAARILPGMEWTHYCGHAGMLGALHPCDNPFCTGAEALRTQVAAKLDQARKNGAIVVLHHPFCPDSGWRLGLDCPHDLIEVWNGGTSSRVTEQTIRWWHRCLCLYAQSPELPDILSALRRGNSYLSCNPDGPGLHVSAGTSLSVLGESLPGETRLNVRFWGLSSGDEIHCITDRRRIGKRTATTPVLNLTLSLADATFCRFEVRGPIENGRSRLKLLSNPVYFLKT